MLPSDSPSPQTHTPLLFPEAYGPVSSPLRPPLTTGRGVSGLFPCLPSPITAGPESQACPSQAEHRIFSISSLFHKENLLSVKRPQLSPSKSPENNFRAWSSLQAQKEGRINSEKRHRQWGSQKKCYKSLPNEDKSARCFLEHMHRKTLPSPG